VTVLSPASATPGWEAKAAALIAAIKSRFIGFPAADADRKVCLAY
jgi:hypothetical protein